MAVRSVSAPRRAASLWVVLVAVVAVARSEAQKPAAGMRVLRTVATPPPPPPPPLVVQGKRNKKGVNWMVNAELLSGVTRGRARSHAATHAQHAGALRGAGTPAAITAAVASSLEEEALLARSTVTGNRCRGGLMFKPLNLLLRYREEFTLLRRLIGCKAAMAYTRWNDAERDAMKAGVRVDRFAKGAKKSKGATGQLKSDMGDAIRHADPRYLIALPFPSCTEGIENERKSGGGLLRWANYFVTRHPALDGSGQAPPAFAWSYSTLFSHRNGGFARRYVASLMRDPDTSVICSEKNANAARRKFKQGDPERFVGFPADLVTRWYGKTRDEFLQKAEDLAAPGGRVFIFSLGPLANVLISHMWNKHPNNTYVDVGTSIDFALGASSRAWMYNRCQRLSKSCSDARWTYAPNATHHTVRPFIIHKGSIHVEKHPNC